MNRERLQMVRDRIAAEPPERLNMAKYTCGTAHCIAGWAWVIGARNVRGVHDDPLWERPSAWLGLTRSQALDLFAPQMRWDLLTQADALAALHSLINAESDDALPVWPERSS